MRTLSGSAKLTFTALLFAAALALLAVAVGTKSAIPLFFMWVPLLTVPWVLARPRPGETPPVNRS